MSYPMYSFCLVLAYSSEEPWQRPSPLRSWNQECDSRNKTLYLCPNQMIFLGISNDVFVYFLNYLFTCLFSHLCYRLVSVMTTQGAKCLNKKKENSLHVLNVDMKLRKLRISACQVRRYLKYQWDDFAFVLARDFSLFSLFLFLPLLPVWKDEGVLLRKWNFIALGNTWVKFLNLT